MKKKSPNLIKNFQPILNNLVMKVFFSEPTKTKKSYQLFLILICLKHQVYHSLPSFILAEFAPFLVEPLCTIINMSLCEGVFPSLLKFASICPIFKKGEKSKCKIYRPISFLSNISKIFERVMYNRVEQFLICSNQFYDRQFGFRSKHSTNHA